MVPKDIHVNKTIKAQMTTFSVENVPEKDSGELLIE